MESTTAFDVEAHKKFGREYERDLLEQDEAAFGVAFVDAAGGRVEPEKVFKSEAGTYADYSGRPVRLWKSEANSQ